MKWLLILFKFKNLTYFCYFCIYVWIYWIIDRLKKYRTIFCIGLRITKQRWQTNRQCILHEIIKKLFKLSSHHKTTACIIIIWTNLCYFILKLTDQFTIFHLLWFIFCYMFLQCFDSLISLFQHFKYFTIHIIVNLLFIYICFYVMWI